MSKEYDEYLESHIQAVKDAAKCFMGIEVEQ